MPAISELSSPEEKLTLEQALDQIEFVNGSLRGAVTNLNNLADTLRSRATRFLPPRCPRARSSFTRRGLP